MSREDYLNFIRKSNKNFMSKCYYCDNFSITIEANGHIIRPICKNHDNRPFDIMEEDINKLFERQVDFE